MCVCVRAPLVPRHSWLGCAVLVCVFGLGLRLRPTTPGWGVGVCVFVCRLPLFPATPGWGVRAVGVCAWAWVSAAPRHAWLGCCGVRVCVRAPLVPRLSWLGRAAWVCVFGFGFPLRPATRGWGVGVCVCWCARTPCNPPLLAGARCVGVGVWVRVLAAPRHSWLGCAVLVCVFGLGLRLRPTTPGWGVGVCVFVCRLPLFPATPGWGVRAVGVCAWAWVSAAPRHAWLGCCGVRVCVRAPLVPRLSWLGRAAWVCVFGFGFPLRPATRGWGVGVCVCWCARTPCNPPLLAGARGVGVGVWVPVLAAPRHSWLGCAVWVCVFGLGFRLRPATPNWGVVVCVFVGLLPLYPASLGLDAPRGCVCLGSGFGSAPPLLAGVLGCVCAGVRALLVLLHSWQGCAARLCVLGLGFQPRPATPGFGVWCACWCACSPCPPHSWPGRAAWVCVFGFGFRLRPATPGWGVGLCVCSYGRSPCTPPLLAGVCGVGVCVRAK